MSAQTPPEPPVNREPLTSESVAKIFQEQIQSEKKWMEAAQTWAKEDRANFKALFDRTYWFIVDIVTVVIAAVAFLGFKTFQEIQKQAFDTANVTLQKRLAEELQTEKIQALVRSVAKDDLRRWRHQSFVKRLLQP